MSAEMTPPDHRVHLYFEDATERRVWIGTASGRERTTRSGTLGRLGGVRRKTFGTPEEAAVDLAAAVDRKLAAGFVEADPSRLVITRPKGRRAATEKAIAKLEQAIGYELPASYRRFLKSHNGGQVEEPYINIWDAYGLGVETIGELYGLFGDESDWASLWYGVRHHMPLLPAGQLPIAGESNLFTLSLGRGRGRVLRFNHEAVDIDDPDFEENEDGQAYYRLHHATVEAETFQAFLGRIANVTLDPPALRRPREVPTAGPKPPKQGRGRRKAVRKKS